MESIILLISGKAVCIFYYSPAFFYIWLLLAGGVAPVFIAYQHQMHGQFVARKRQD
jgi:hypothetical protein